MQRRWNRLIPLVVRTLIGVGLLVAAVIVFALLRATRPHAERHPVEVRIPNVRTIEVVAQEVNSSWPAHGMLRAMHKADVAAQVAARVVTRPDAIEDGARVRAGQVIVQLEETDYALRVQSSEDRLRALDAQLAQLDVEESALDEQVALAEDEVRLSQAELDRARTAVAEGGGIQADIDRAMAALQRARREVSALRQRLTAIAPRRAQIEAQKRGEERTLELARQDLARTRIVSPIDGFIQQVLVDEGEFVAVGQQVARIVALDRLEVPLEVPVSAARAIRVGDTATLSADSAALSTFEGRVARIAPEASPQTRSMIVFVEVEQELDADRAFIQTVDEKSSILLPGQYVTGRVHSRERERRVVVPRRAIVDDRVFVAKTIHGEGGEILVAAHRPIVVSEHITGSFPDIDPEETQWAVVGEGLNEGDRVIVSNLDELSDGMAIRLDGEVR